MALLAAFAVLTALSALSNRTWMNPNARPSAELTQQKQENGNTVRFDYLDEAGNISFASDKHYATLLRTLDEKGKNILERYLDAEGNPAIQPAGHAAVAREYNESGQNTVIRYLDEEGHPVRITSGYAVIIRTYNGKGLVETERYADENGMPAAAGGGQYGIRREYNEQKQNTVIQYLDAEGRVAPVKNGYAVVRRTFDEKGRVTRQFYFDAEGQPAALQTGQYGVYRAYDENGKNWLTTYLDAEGNPINTKSGYASIQRTYNEEGRLDTERYFSADGRPATGGKGQYGVKYAGTDTLYLNAEGNPVFRLDQFLLNHPFTVILSGIILAAAAAFAGRKTRMALLFAYVLFIFYMTITTREMGEQKGRFELFWSYRQFLSSSGMRMEILNNIWLFVLLGMLLAGLWPGWAVLMIPVLLSVLIEGAQYVLGVGLCEIDDVISNSLGGALGMALMRMWSGTKEKTPRI